MVNSKMKFHIMFLVVIGCLVMAWVDGILSPNYAIKSAIKLLTFLILPIGYFYFNKQVSFRTLFMFNRKNVIFSVFLGIGVYFLVLGAYFILRNYFNFSNVTLALQDNIGVNKNNFVFVALYISFINSLLEEFFFRGFAFLALKMTTTRKIAYLFSASAFSLYHIAIMTNWFTPPLFILLIGCLFVAGLLFNWLNEKSNTMLSSWMVHMWSNLAINTIGFILFGVL